MSDPGHVVEAILAIESMRPQPRFVVHLACGDNALVSALRRRRCDGLGIDPASAGLTCTARPPHVQESASPSATAWPTAS